MILVRAADEDGVEIPTPFNRRVKVLLAPDKGVEELTFNAVTVAPGGATDLHRHDRPELIYIVSGSGTCIHDGAESPIGSEVVLWVLAGEEHQIVNVKDAPMKLISVFIPPYRSDQVYDRCLIAAQVSSCEC